VRARLTSGELDFERTAIGEHLLLGGDNLGLALARLVEEKLKDVRLTLRQRYALRLACCFPKEQLLSDASLERVPVTILGSGRTVVGGAISVELTHEEVLRTLTDGFLPITAPDEMPVRGRTTGLREFGLPYAADAAITRHLAAFLTHAAAAMNKSSSNLRADPMPCSLTAVPARRRSLASGSPRRSRRGSVRVGGQKSSTTQPWKVPWRAAPPTTAAFAAAPACASGPAART